MDWEHVKKMQVYELHREQEDLGVFLGAQIGRNHRRVQKVQSRGPFLRLRHECLVVCCTLGGFRAG